MKTGMQTENLPTYPLITDQQDQLSVVPGICSKLLKVIAWLILSSGELILFWQTNNWYSVSTLHGGRTGLRVHLFGVLVQERGYFDVKGEKHDYGIPFGGALFTALQVILMLLTAYCALRVLIDLIRCIPRAVYAESRTMHAPLSPGGRGVGGEGVRSLDSLSRLIVFDYRDTLLDSRGAKASE